MKLVYREPKSIGSFTVGPWSHAEVHTEEGGGGDQAGRFGGVTEKGMKSGDPYTNL